MNNKIKLSGALHHGRLLLANHARQKMVASIPAGLTLEDVLKPAFWVHYSAQIVPNMIIECMCEDGTWEAELRVMFVSPEGVEMGVRFSQTYAQKNKPAETAKHFIKWISPPKKYGVIHKDTGKVVADGLYPISKAEQLLATL